MMLRLFLLGAGIAPALLMTACKTPNPEVVAASTGTDLFLDTDPQKAAETALATVKSTAASDRTQALEIFFRKGNYPEALEMARDLKSISEEGTEERDVAHFIEAVSLYYLGRHGEAAPLLASHLEKFPGSRHRESAVFFEGSNLTKLGQWQAASEKLDAFLSEYPESVLMEYALYDRATSYLAMGENEKAAETAQRIEETFVYSKIRDRAGVVRGDALLAMENLDGAAEAYANALAGSRQLGHAAGEASALRGLIEVNALKGDFDESQQHYDTFFATHGDSKEALAASVAGLPAMIEKGEGAKGLERAEEIIAGLPEGTPSTDIRKALTGYAESFRKENGAEELAKHLGNLSTNPKIGKRVREQVVVARLDALENYFPEREAEIRVFYDEIVRSFNRDDLSDETLIKIARHVESADEVEARKIYEKVVMRTGSKEMAAATLGLARLDAKSGDVAAEDKAIEGLSRVIHLYGNVTLAEEATLELARLHSKRSEWQKAYSAWETYLRNPAWITARSEAEEGKSMAKQRGGSAIEEKPMEPAFVRANEVSDPYLVSLNRANDLIGQGKKKEAFMVLDDMLKGTESLAIEPSEEVRAAIRRATLIHQDLGVELGMQVGVGIGEP
ncbi:MAG: tetratricopeptide repeat protein [Verrucomicrobiota bacterium]